MIRAGVGPAGNAFRRVAVPALVGLLSLVALWAFASYLHPGFTGEVAGAIFRCN